MNQLKSLIVIIVLMLATQTAYADESTNCQSSIANASYTGPYLGVENNLSNADFYRDLVCASRFKNKKYPKGFVTIFGSSRISESNHSANSVIDHANDLLYQQIYDLAYNWSKHYAKQYPILSGAGPGIMEAASRGATKAGGPSIGYTTYYGPSRNKKNGDASKAFWQYRPKKGKTQSIISDGLIFSSVAIREGFMISHSAAMVFAPGGTGTEWEIYQTIEQMKSGQLKQVPIYIVGDKKIHWQSLYSRLDDMVLRGTIKRHEVESLFVHVDNPKDVLKLLVKDLKL
ncbi:MAG: LOG family protein [Enterobacterales bacterium]|nr:LOG family protein [Enterobacterales bacterium]